MKIFSPAANARHNHPGQKARCRAIGCWLFTNKNRSGFCLACLLLSPLCHSLSLFEPSGLPALQVPGSGKAFVDRLAIHTRMLGSHASGFPLLPDLPVTGYFGSDDTGLTGQKAVLAQVLVMANPEDEPVETLLCLESADNRLQSLPSDCRPLPPSPCGLIVNNVDTVADEKPASLILPYACDLSLGGIGSGLHPQPCEQESCLTWEGGSQRFTFDFSEASLPDTPLQRQEYGIWIPWIMHKNRDGQGQIVYYWYDDRGNRHFISQQEYRYCLFLSFESLLQRLYPEIFGPSLPAGGGWHVYVKREKVKVRQASGRGKGELPPARGRGERPFARGRGGRSQASGGRGRSQRFAPYVKPPPGSGAAKGRNQMTTHDRAADTIKSLMDEFEGGYLKKIADRFKEKYDGRKHGAFCNRIKKVTMKSGRNLSPNEKKQLQPFVIHLTEVIKTSQFNSKTISICIHSLTSSGLLHPLRQDGQLTQAIQALTEVLLNQVTQESSFDEQGVVNLLWALAKLVENGLDYAQANRAVTALLPLVVQMAQGGFTSQGLTIALWALAKLVENGLDHGQANWAVMELLPRVVQMAQWGGTSQGLAIALWAVAKLVENGLPLEQTNGAVMVLLPQVVQMSHQHGFIPQDVVNLLWALAKLVENGLDYVQASRAVTALLPQVVQMAQGGFTSQGLASALWALAKLVENGLPLEQANEAVIALLPQVVQVAEGSHQPGFTPQEAAKLLWSIAFLGEWIAPQIIEEILSLLSFSDQYSVFDQTQLLWSFMVFIARKITINYRLELLMTDWYQALSQQPIDNQLILAMAAVWLGLKANVNPEYKTCTSRLQRRFQHILATKYPGIKVVKEYSLNHLPPVDFYLPEYKLAIEVQGPHHFTSQKSLSKTGRSILKAETYRRLGIRVLELTYKDIDDQNLASVHEALMKNQSITQQSQPSGSNDDSSEGE